MQTPSSFGTRETGAPEPQRFQRVAPRANAKSVGPPRAAIPRHALPNPWGAPPARPLPNPLAECADPCRIRRLGLCGIRRPASPFRPIRPPSGCCRGGGGPLFDVVNVFESNYREAARNGDFRKTAFERRFEKRKGRLVRGALFPRSARRLSAATSHAWASPAAGRQR